MEIKDEMHFVCLDKRKKKSNEVYIVLANGQEVLLPSAVTRVPALLLLRKGNSVIFGDDIYEYIEPMKETVTNYKSNQSSTPESFSMRSNGYGVSSDVYSYLDQGSDEMSAKGSGGMRQQHHYASYDYSSKIETPPDTYTPDKIGEVSMDELQQKRNKDIRI
tara:strand:+ start:5582 stop:6067 length:486 start_codon:yes stop_codon:yes gene_type:complete